MSKLDLSDSRTHYNILRKIGKALTSTLHKHEILEMIMDFIGSIYAPENWSLIMLDEEKNVLYFEIAVGNISDTIKDMVMAPGKGIVGYSMTQKEPVIIMDAYSDPRFDTGFDTQFDFKTDNIICMPLVSKNRVFGAIELVNTDAACFTEASLDMLQSLCDFAAIAIENAVQVARIKDLTVRDDCTRLYNSRYMHQILTSIIKEADESRHPFSIVFLDMDHFKTVNDTHGHLVGSRLLYEVGELILEEIHPTPHAIRYGGDEFVIIMPETSVNEALPIAKQIHQRIMDTRFLTEKGLNIQLTASFGIAAYPEHAKTSYEVLKLADTAMYDVKKAGRNQVFTVTGETGGA